MKIVESGLTAEDNYEVLDVCLTELLQKLGVETFDEESMKRLISYERQLRIALGLPVEVSN